MSNPHINYQDTCNLGQLGEEKFQENPGHILLKTSDGAGNILEYSSAQVYANILAWADYFQQQGIAAGERIAIISGKNIRHFFFFHACWRLGIIAVPICESLGDKEMQFILQDCAPKLILADTPFMAKVQGIAGDYPVVELTKLPIDTDPATAPQIPVADFSSDEIAVLIYTSGSTGMPKGVMLTHRNLFVNACGALEFFHINPSDSVVSLLPYWHAYALTVEMLCVTFGGAACIVPHDIRDFRKNLSNYQPTIMIAVPRIVEMIKAGIDKMISALPPKRKKLVDKAIYNASRIFTAGSRFNGGLLRILMHHIFYNPVVFSKFRKGMGGKLRYIVCGGAPMDLELQVFFKYLGIPCLVGYGLTEASPIVSANMNEQHKLDSCGKLFSWLKEERGGDYTFKDEEGNCSKENRGLLMLKGDCVMKGYWHHTDASAKTIENGWLNTGDMGWCDSDGYLHIAGRQGNMIVTIGGEKLHPEHIEDAIRLSPFITEVMVFGEKCKNVYACVNVNKDMAQNMTNEEIAQKAHTEVLACTKGLTTLEKPKAVLVLPEFNQENGTLTATLKIRRFKIKETYKAEIEAFLEKNGEEIATRHEVGIAHSRIQETL